METNQRKNRRIQLQRILEEILGTTNVYFQPPENIKLKYPCIIYEVGAGLRTPADNTKYLYNQGYSVTFITKDPDPDIPDKLLDLEYSSFERQFITEGLYHWVFFIYF